MATHNEHFNITVAAAATFLGRHAGGGGTFQTAQSHF